MAQRVARRPSPCVPNGVLLLDLIRVAVSSTRQMRSEIVSYRRRINGIRYSSVAVLLLLATSLGGCAAAVTAVSAAGEIRKGFAGLQQLVSSSEPLAPAVAAVAEVAPSPLAGTYRGFRALGPDTVRYYIRTALRPSAQIVDSLGNVTGYALSGMTASSLDSLEVRIGDLAASRTPGGRALLFIEGTQAPTPGARALYPAAILGQLRRGESAAADLQAAELRRLDVDMEAPNVDLAGRGIPHELFGSVAEGIFQVRPNGMATYEQEHELEDGRVLILSFERISRTTLPGDP
jgi:hypothetical protein